MRWLQLPITPMSTTRDTENIAAHGSKKLAVYPAIQRQGFTSEFFNIFYGALASPTSSLVVLVWASQVALGLVLLPHSTHCFFLTPEHRPCAGVSGTEMRGHRDCVDTEGITHRR